MIRPLLVQAAKEEILRWGIKPEKLPAGEAHLAGLIVDRIVSVLGDHADEWDDLAYEASLVDAFGMVGPLHYLAVLADHEETP